jgi:hypothetical protein
MYTSLSTDDDDDDCATKEEEVEDEKEQASLSLALLLLIVVLEIIDSVSFSSPIASTTSMIHSPPPPAVVSGEAAVVSSHIAVTGDLASRLLLRVLRDLLPLAADEDDADSFFFLVETAAGIGVVSVPSSISLNIAIVAFPLNLLALNPFLAEERDGFAVLSSARVFFPLFGALFRSPKFG